jgi:toxin YoeB
VRLVFEDQGREDYASRLKTDRKMLARVNKLTEDVRRDPFTGIGKPEPLGYHLPGAWSRQIDDEHRLVYIAPAWRTAPRARSFWPPGGRSRPRPSRSPPRRRQPTA